MRTMLNILQDKVAIYNQLTGAEFLYKKVRDMFQEMGDFTALNILAEKMIELQKELGGKQSKLTSEVDEIQNKEFQNANR